MAVCPPRNGRFFKQCDVMPLISGGKGRLHAGNASAYDGNTSAPMEPKSPHAGASLTDKRIHGTAVVECGIVKDGYFRRERVAAASIHTEVTVNAGRMSFSRPAAESC